MEYKVVITSDAEEDLDISFMNCRITKTRSGNLLSDYGSVVCYHHTEEAGRCQANTGTAAHG